jgi:hypothetical protein
MRKLFVMVLAVALLTLGSFTSGGFHHHDLGQIVADGESGGGD